ncbi:MAG TPA: c-type cytochrome domain-containing protein, partial [Verrucomicrobiae bacterium]|nr:c-type cytochrome domain-containing protein [Verrucomicrobiae bacterium]
MDSRAQKVDVAKLPPPAKGTVDFEKDIKPIFEASCFRCHGPERPKSHFRLDNRISALQGGDNGVDIFPGNSAKSPLVHYVAGLVEDMQMPPDGKGNRLTISQISLLRAWIDQGAGWGVTNPPVQVAFSLTPVIRAISIEGDGGKFREIEGMQPGAGGGVQKFTLREQMGPDKVLTADGHVSVPDNDYRLTLELRKTDVGFVRGGFEESRKYFDDTGGYYRPFSPPAFSLGRDLGMDVGRAWVEFGLTPPKLPEIVIGYEYQFRDGTESTLEWGNVGGKNIYPASEEIHEHTHVIKARVTHEFFGLRLEDNAQVELYDLKTRHDDAASFTLGPAPD